MVVIFKSLRATPLRGSLFYLVTMGQGDLRLTKESIRAPKNNFAKQKNKG